MAELLFQQYDLTQVLEAEEKKMVGEISSLDEDRVLNTPAQDLCDYFVNKCRVNSIKIEEADIHSDYCDVQIDVRYRFEYAVFDKSCPTYVQGTRITFHIPFSGDYQLFRCSPNTISFDAPRATVSGSKVTFTYDLIPSKEEQVKGEFSRDFEALKRYVGKIERIVQNFNSTIHAKASKCIDSRREKILRDRQLVESLGFPLIRREEVPVTYAAPEVKRKILPRLPSASTKPYTPEPELEMENYEHILSVTSSMVNVMEQSPRAFRGMNEEDLRQHFLVQLNGHYEGQATGETFNFEGKTDILIRVDGRNIFISECKFWTGSTALTATIDQLLRYTCWRDTKTAILVFNRNKNLTAVLKSIPEAVKGHIHFKRECSHDSETGFRYIFGNPNDGNREIVLTILVFDVPK